MRPFVYYVSISLGFLDPHHPTYLSMFLVLKIPHLTKKFPPLNSFRSNYSIYEVKNCHNAETIWKFPHFPLSKKNSFNGNYLRKYSKQKSAFSVSSLTIAAMPSLLCRLQILVGWELEQCIPTVVHTVPELSLWTKGIEWSHPSTMSSYSALPPY